MVPLTLDEAEYFASQIYSDRYGPQWAFKRETFHTSSWSSGYGGAFPKTVHVRLPFRVTVSFFSFRSPRFYSRKYSPTKFDFIGSNDCNSWTAIVQVSDVRWNRADEKKSWNIPIKQQGLYRCYGIRVHSVSSLDRNVNIQDIKLWKG